MSILAIDDLSSAACRALLRSWVTCQIAQAGSALGVVPGGVGDFLSVMRISQRMARKWLSKWPEARWPVGVADAYCESLVTTICHGMEAGRDTTRRRR